MSGLTDARPHRLAQAELPALFVVGAPRSGTTLLYKALCLHPQAAWVSNWVRRFPAVPALSLLNRGTRPVPALRRRAWFGAEGDNAYVYGRPRSRVERAFPAPTEGGTLFRRHLGPTDGAGSGPPGGDGVAGLRRALGTVATLGTPGAAPVLVSKHIDNNRRIADLHAALPGARFVHLVRDGRAVALSLSRVDWWDDTPLWWWPGTPADWRAAGRDPWEACARAWVEEIQVVDQALASLPHAAVHQLPYEDLVADPRGRLSEVARFADLAPSSAWLAELDAIRFPDRRDRWRVGLDAAALEVVEAIQGDELARLGYRS